MNPRKELRRSHSSPDVRALAAAVLTECEEDPFLHAQERLGSVATEGRVGKRDRRFLTELVMGTLRRRRTLDSVLEAYSNVPLNRLESAVLQSLRLGLYQLLFLDGVPPFAAISATVAALGSAEESGGRRRRAFVNAVLRTIDRECRRVPLERDRGGASPRKRLEIRGRKVCFFSRAVFVDPEDDPAGYRAQVFSHPPELVRRWQERFGAEECERMLELDNEPGPLFVRANRQRLERDALIERLRAEGIRCGPGNRPMSVEVLDPVGELLSSKAFRSGDCTVQDETAMAVVELLVEEGVLEQQDSWKVLDLCAAPGGKVTHLAELLGERGSLLACDRDAHRAQRVQENAQRLGLRSVHVVVRDALEETPPAPRFDLVLLDAPCSNTGVLRRKPEARERVEKRHLEALGRLQHDLLRAAAAHVTAGGYLLYSTCSLEREENEAQVQSFLREQPRFSSRAQRSVFPQPRGGDGGFCALLAAEDAG